MFISGIISLLLLPILIKMLGTIKYGAFELVTSLEIINFFLEFGMGTTLIKFIPEYKYDKEKLQNFIWSYFYLKLTVTFIGIIFIIILGFYFDNIFQIENIKNIEDIKLSVYIFAFGIFLRTIATFLENILKGFVYFAQINLLKSFAVFLFFLVCYGYYLYNDNYSIIEISIIWFLARPILIIINMLILFKNLKLLTVLTPTKFKLESIKPTLKYLFGMSYISIVGQLYNKMPKIILGIFLGSISVGYWGIIERVKRPIFDIQNAILRPLLPLLSDKKTTKLSTTKIFQASRLNSIAISFLAIIILVNIDIILYFWIGKEFMSISLLIKIIFLPFVSPNSGVFQMMYYASGKTKINKIFLTLNSFISLSLGTISLYIYKDMLIFICIYTFTFIVLTLDNIFSHLKHLKINYCQYIKKVMIPIFLINIITFILSSCFTSYIPFTIWGLILDIIITISIYILLIPIFLPREDLIFIKSLFKKIKTK